ncbi:WhiB family transcriptional regulator [Streptomyces sp. NPDC017454]|uniref:WhiB family transcriptional regulator n=1 Tax=Streptomyces sp. NPDC017454 TaxID=3364997 RepID=UPI00379500A2
MCGHPVPRLRGNQTWQGRAACALAVEARNDPDLFFPSKYASEQRIRLAKEICALCPVKVACLEAALESRDAAGIRGGLTEEERRVNRNEFELRCDPARVTAALAGRDIYLTKPERGELVRRAAAAGTPTVLLARVLKVSEGHAQKLLRRELRVKGGGHLGTYGIVDATSEAASA